MRAEDELLRDILESAERCVQRIVGKSETEFLADELTRDAVIWRLVLIGEAARYLSAGTRAASAEIPWRKVVRNRNVLVHDYYAIDYLIVWRTVTTHLPALVDAVRRTLASRATTP